MTEERLLTPGEVARRLGVSVDTLTLWDESGRLLARRSRGGHRRWLEADVERYIAEGNNPKESLHDAIRRIVKEELAKQTK